MTQTVLTLIDRKGQASSVTPDQIETLLRMGVIHACDAHAHTWHADDLTHTEVDRIIDELGLHQCGFCMERATHEAPTQPGERTFSLVGKAHSLRVVLCDECALLLQTGDHDLLIERSIENTVRLNMRVARAAVEQRGGPDAVRAEVQPTMETACRETFAMVTGPPRPLPRSGGIIVIGGGDG